jgi:hypothetical protein
VRKSGEECLHEFMGSIRNAKIERRVVVEEGHATPIIHPIRLGEFVYIVEESGSGCSIDGVKSSFWHGVSATIAGPWTNNTLLSEDMLRK